MNRACRSVPCRILVLLQLLIGLRSVSAAPPASGCAADYLQALIRFEPWAESIWKDDPQIPGAGYFGDGNSEGNGGIRGTCGVALAYAVLAREFPDAPEHARRLQRVNATLRYAALTHASGPADALAADGKKWGVFDAGAKWDPHGWQSPLWAATMGLSAVLLEKQLDPDVVQACKKVVATEADVLVKIPPASGYIGDTKCEENAWDTTITALAAAWMPDDPRAKDWLDTAKKYLVNTYTVPDPSNDPLKSWITTQTLYPSFAVENHGFYHPMYHIDGGNSLGDTFVTVSICNPTVAKELEPFCEHNVIPVFDFLKGIILDTGDTAYPSGVDWSLHSFEHSNYLAYLSTHFHQPVAAWAEPRLAKNILARQAVNGDGRFVGDSCPNGFYREAVEARQNAIAYLHHQINGFPPDSPGEPPKDQVTHYDDIKLIFQRTENQLVTVSYGAQTMALVYPLNGTNLGQKFLISPNTKSFLGVQKRTAKLVDFKTTPSGFRAELLLNSDHGHRSTMLIESSDGAVVFIETPTPGERQPSKNWYLTAIENHPFTGGQRNLIWDGGDTPIKERSGDHITTPVGRPVSWLNIDNWYGLIAVSDGDLNYQAASNYNRNGAAEDAIAFQPVDATKPRAAIILPRSDAKTTAAVVASIKWSVSDSACSLSFTRPDGDKAQVRQSIVAASPN